MIKSINIHPLLLMVFAFALIYSTFIVINFIYRKLGLDTSNVLIPQELMKYPPWVLGVMGVIIAPWLETLIFQHWVKRLLNKITLTNQEAANTTDPCSVPQ